MTLTSPPASSRARKPPVKARGMVNMTISGERRDWNWATITRYTSTMPSSSISSSCRMASMMASRRPQSTSSKMTTPSRKMTLMATCQSPPQTVVVIPAIIALTPKPDAQASGRLAKMPMQMVMMPAPRQVAQASAPASMPAPESTAGLTAMM